VAPSRLKDQRDWNILKRGEYLISTEQATNQLWSFLRLVNGDRQAAKATSTPLAAIPNAFQSGEKSLRSILWSPFAEILRGLGVARILSDSATRDGSGSICQLLYAGSDLHTDTAKALCAALIDGWKSLRMPEYRARIVRSLMDDPLFVETFERSTGIDTLY
jgi:ABC-type nitrate/sulfonate/bicarbonate transport system substrate-binding protein